MTMQCKCGLKLKEINCPICREHRIFTISRGGRLGCRSCNHIFASWIQLRDYNRDRSKSYHRNRPRYEDDEEYEEEDEEYEEDDYELDRRRYEYKEFEASNKAQKSGCFIATAAFGSSMTKEIDVLRKWRDKVLLRNPFGKGVVRLYYDVSPAIASHISDSSLRRYIVRCILNPIISLIKKFPYDILEE